MTGMGKYSKDPLDLARGQMDFARMASDAPTSKQILFKAQTIIPAVPAKPVWQKAAPAAGAALAAGLLFVPVIPQGSSLERLDVNFEGSLTREHAQQMQERAFARSARADDRHEFSGFDTEVDATQDRNLDASLAV